MCWILDRLTPRWEFILNTPPLTSSVARRLRCSSPHQEDHQPINEGLFCGCELLGSPHLQGGLCERRWWCGASSRNKYLITARDVSCHLGCCFLILQRSQASTSGFLALGNSVVEPVYTRLRCVLPPKQQLQDTVSEAEDCTPKCAQNYSRYVSTFLISLAKCKRETKGEEGSSRGGRGAHLNSSCHPSEW